MVVVVVMLRLRIDGRGLGGAMSAALWLPPAIRRRYDRPVAVDLFAGCGGFSLGLHQAGYHVAAAVEFDESAALTYMVNLARPGVRIHTDTAQRKARLTKAAQGHLGLRGGKGSRLTASVLAGPRRGELTRAGSLAGGGWIATEPPSSPGCEHLFFADIRNLTGRQVLDALQLGEGDVDLVAGGPPCQGFSTAGKRDVMDPRNSLVFEFVRLVLEIQPRAMVMENVPAMVDMVTPEGVPVVDALCRVLSDGGFSGYEALRRSLLTTAGAGAAVRDGRTRGDRRQPDNVVSRDEQRQPSLFAGGLP